MVTAVSEAKETEEIVIEDIGAIRRLAIPIPPEGGLVVLRGENGGGKSGALETCSAVFGNSKARTALRPRDGAKKGVVEGLGIKITVGRANRESGELEVASIEDTVDIGGLVDPGVDDLNAADGRRLKALLRVAGAKADIDLFVQLLGEKPELDEALIKERDLVKQASLVKSWIEKKARAEEGSAEAAALDATIALRGHQDIDINAESDEQKLQSEYRAAVQADARIDSQLKAAEDAAEAHETAQKSLERAKQSYHGPSIEDAAKQFQAAVDALQTHRDIVADLEARLNDARNKVTFAESILRERTTTRDAAQQHFETIAGWERQLAQEIPQAPSADEIEAAKLRLDQATKAMQDGGLVRAAKAARVKADEFNVKAKQHRKLAEQWRDAAKGVDDVLSDVVSELGCPIKVGDDDKGLRLTINHPKRGEIYFSELSVGEKWAVVIPIAIKAVGPGGVFVIPQTAWEGLQPSIRRDIVAQLKGSQVTAITAQCDDGEIHAEVAA